MPELTNLPAAPITAHVGYTETDNDYHRTVDAEDWLKRIGNPEEIDLFARMDAIDLAAGRDFLTEEKRYDVVVLHHLFAYRIAEAPTLARVSDVHAPETWRARLATCRAAYIFAYGGTSEVSGGFLQDIPGYDILSYDAVKAVYQKRQERQCEMIDKQAPINYERIPVGRTLTATFVPEAWIRDEAVEIDGRRGFDVTEAYLAMTVAERKNLHDNRASSEDLVPSHILKLHGEHPFHVEIEEAIEAFHSHDDAEKAN